MQTNAIVIVSLVSPKEKIWGQLLRLESPGVTVRGIKIEAFDDLIRQIGRQEETAVGPETVFFPMHRVERIALDESNGSIPSLSECFHSKVGMTIEAYLETDVRKV